MPHATPDQGGTFLTYNTFGRASCLRGVAGPSGPAASGIPVEWNFYLPAASSDARKLVKGALWT